jgi:ABC-type glycerol-3-phosphate transport system permease component
MSVRLWRRYRRGIREALAHMVLIPLAIIFMIPFFWMLSTSLKPDSQIFLWPPAWIPKPFVWSNYPESIGFIPFWAYIRNTLVVAFFAIVGVLFSCPPVAYSFSRIPFLVGGGGGGPAICRSSYLISSVAPSTSSFCASSS